MKQRRAALNPHLIHPDAVDQIRAQRDGSVMARHGLGGTAEVAQRGAAVLLPEARLKAGELAPVLRDLLGADASRREAMGHAARQAALPGAAERLADLCLGLTGVRP